MVPLLVQAQERDPDRGVAYTQRLLSLAVTGLAVTTLLATLAAPLLTLIYSSSGNADKSHLTTLFAYLLLPEIFFYGLGAMIGAILNTRGVFGAPAWAPVLNNIVVIVVAGLFIAITAGHAVRATTSPTTGETLLLGIGTTLGIVAQALVLLPALRRTGFRWKFRLDLRGSRLGEAGPLALWVIGYVVVEPARLPGAAPAGQRRAGQAARRDHVRQRHPAVPDAVRDPRRLAADRADAADEPGRRPRRPGQRAADLSLGSRLSALALLPVTALFIVLGPAIGTVIVRSRPHQRQAARTIGTVLAVFAFGLVPFALTMLQLRVFYAVKDARTPTLINLGMMAARVLLSLLAAAVLPDRHLVAGLLGRHQPVVRGRRDRRRGPAARAVRPVGHGPDRTGLDPVPDHVGAGRAGRLAGADGGLRRARPRLRRLADRGGARLGGGRRCARAHGAGQPLGRDRRRVAWPARTAQHRGGREAPCGTGVREEARSPAEAAR